MSEEIEQRWKIEENLLDVFTQISQSYDNYKLPIQIRLEKNKMKIIEDILATNPNAYKDVDYLIDIASLLGLENTSEIYEIKKLVAEYACKNGNFDFAREIVLKLVKAKYKPACEMCYQLANSQKALLSTSQRIELVIV